MEAILFQGRSKLDKTSEALHKCIHYDEICLQSLRINTNVPWDNPLNVLFFLEFIKTLCQKSCEIIRSVAANKNMWLLVKVSYSW